LSKVSLPSGLGYVIDVNSPAGRRVASVLHYAGLPGNRWYLFSDPMAAPVYVYGQIESNNQRGASSMSILLLALSFALILSVDWSVDSLAAFVVCEVGFRRTFGITRSQIRLIAATAVLTTIPLGTEVGALAQVGALTAIMAAAFTAEAWWPAPAGHESGRGSTTSGTGADRSSTDAC